MKKAVNNFIYIYIYRHWCTAVTVVMLNDVSMSNYVFISEFFSLVFLNLSTKVYIQKKVSL